MNKPDDWRAALVTFPKSERPALSAAEWVTAIEAWRGALERKRLKKIDPELNSG